MVSVVGIRRQESPNRAKKPISAVNKLLSSISKQTSGIDWNPILTYTEEDVWATHHLESLPIHEAYQVYGTSRVSCAYCVLAKDSDLKAATVCEDNQAVYRELCDLEIASTFAFKESCWLSDLRPDLLTPQQQQALPVAKQKARQREQIESQIPAHLLYSEGWPQVMPTLEEAVLLADIRRQIGVLMDLPVEYITAEAIIQHYQYLMGLRAFKQEMKAILEKKRVEKNQAQNLPTKKRKKASLQKQSQLCC